ncbi:hypothetical protein HDU97_001832 [Phlyctochytrium planicorne]|nr:hypothetical protein HDU97_001832 [Phlyctochytrium planicorne]
MIQQTPTRTTSNLSNFDSELEQEIPYPFSDNEDSTEDLRTSVVDQPTLADGQAESDEDLDISHPAEGLNTLKVEKVLHNGFLMKKGEKRKTWKKRWFVLRATILAYYKNEKEYELLKIIPLADVHTIAEVRDLKKRKNVFGVVTRQRTYYVMCDSKEQMDEWLSKLKEAHRGVQRLLRKESNSSSRSSHALNVNITPASPLRPSPLSAPPLSNPGPSLYSSSSGSNNALNITADGQFGGMASHKFEARVRFLEGDDVRPPTEEKKSEPPLVKAPSIPGGLQTLSDPVTSTQPKATDEDVSDSQSQVSNLSSAFTMESMLTVLSTPSMIQGVSNPPIPATPVTAAPAAAVTAPTVNTISLPSSSVEPTTTDENSYGSPSADDNRGSTSQRPSQASIRPLTGILVNRNPASATTSSPLAQSATSYKGTRRGENVLSSSDEDDDGGNESDGTINDDKVVCEGYLFKQGTKYKQSWKKRWIVVRNGRITCYKNNSEYVVKRMVPLRNVLDVHEIDPQGRHQYCFKVVLSKRTMILAADSEEDLYRWVSSLRNLHKVVLRRERNEE